jgi:hypothetical protein
MAGKRMPSRNLRFRSRGKPTTMRCARNSQSPAESGCRRDAAAIDPSISGTAGRLTSAISALAFFWHSNLQLLLSRAFCPSASFHVLSLIFPSSWPFAAVYRAHHNLLKRKIAGDRALCQRFPPRAVRPTATRLARSARAFCSCGEYPNGFFWLLRGGLTTKIAHSSTPWTISSPSPQSLVGRQHCPRFQGQVHSRAWWRSGIDRRYYEESPILCSCSANVV